MKNLAACLCLTLLACAAPSPAEIEHRDARIEHLMEDLQGPELMLSSAARLGSLDDAESRRNLKICLKVLKEIEEMEHEEEEFRLLNRASIKAVEDMLKLDRKDGLPQAWRRVERSCSACHRSYQ
ncbi:MAG: hypothetical protein RL095_1431 [Verrucomicrobiota bacterium]|jgi:hypothetical protein